jgi:hypothetical protein
MNTLPRAITARFFPNPDSYNALRVQWSSLMNSEHKHRLTAAHHLFYLALLGRDWRKAFTPPTNPRKLANGALSGWAMFRSLQSLHSRFCEEELLAPFDRIITPAMLNELRSLLAPAVYPFGFRPGQFSGTLFPFDAYQEPTPTEKTGSNE